jgi:hypothetical protein
VDPSSTTVMMRFLPAALLIAAAALQLHIANSDARLPGDPMNRVPVQAGQLQR